MSLIKEVDSFVERAYPGATLTKDYSFVSIPSVHMRIVAVGKEQFLADELCSEKCWLVTIGLEPTSAFPTARSETREFHRQTDGRSESVRQLMFELGGRVDIATVRSEFGQDVLPSALSKNDPMLLSKRGPCNGTRRQGVIEF